MIYAFVALMLAILLALVIGGALGRHVHYARGFEAGAHHAARTIRTAVQEASYR